MAKTRVSAEAVIERAVAEETAQLREDIKRKDREIKTLQDTLAKICRIAGGLPQMAAHEPSPDTEGEDFGPGLPPERRPKAVFEEPAAGPAGELNPQDNLGEGRWA